MLDYKEYIRDTYNFPKEGIIFRDIQPLLSNGDVFNKAISDMLKFSR
jgi:adenine phosphoribosyltransferase